MKDRFGREINYLRVSVTDRCNLRCRYCTPAEGVSLLPREKILSYEEILDVVVEAVALGVTKVRLTGGEPLVRQDIVRLVQMLAGVDAIKDLCMSTNGILLEQFAQPLAEAGLQRVNISLDAMSPQRYRYITRGGAVSRVLAGIDAAREAGLQPVKLNCVVEESADEPDARAVARFGRENDLPVRFIPRMDLQEGIFSTVDGGTGGECDTCNRLRLSADGFIRPCLFSDLAYSVRKLGAAQALKTAIQNKPRRGTSCEQCYMRRIGG
ncbi:MAG: radical SAM protein [Armatimonadota bacterium]